MTISLARKLGYDNAELIEIILDSY